MFMLITGEKCRDTRRKSDLTENCDLICSDEIAGCIEKAYEQIQFGEATRVLFFSSPKKMTEYAKKVCIFLFGYLFLGQVKFTHVVSGVKCKFEDFKTISNNKKPKYHVTWSGVVVLK